MTAREETLLAIDTSTQVASVAIVTNERVVAEQTWIAGHGHTRQLLPVIQGLLHLVGLSVMDLTAIGVVIGPGGFTGLRIGVSTAKTLAWSLNVPCLGVGSLDALAYSVAVTTGWLCAILEAGRGDWYTAAFEMEAAGLRRVCGPSISRPDALCATLTADTLVCVESALAASRFQAGCPTARFPINVVTQVPRAAHTGHLALAMLRTGAVGPLEEVQPMYIRRSAAEERADAP